MVLGLDLEQDWPETRTSESTPEMFALSIFVGYPDQAKNVNGYLQEVPVILFQGFSHGVVMKL